MELDTSLLATATPEGIVGHLLQIQHETVDPSYETSLINQSLLVSWAVQKGTLSGLDQWLVEKVPYLPLVEEEDLLPLFTSPRISVKSIAWRQARRLLSEAYSHSELLSLAHYQGAEDAIETLLEEETYFTREVETGPCTTPHCYVLLSRALGVELRQGSTLPYHTTPWNGSMALVDWICEMEIRIPMGDVEGECGQKRRLRKAGLLV